MHFCLVQQIHLCHPNCCYHKDKLSTKEANFAQISDQSQPRILGCMRQSEIFLISQLMVGICEHKMEWRSEEQKHLSIKRNMYILREREGNLILIVKNFFHLWDFLSENLVSCSRTFENREFVFSFWREISNTV